MSRSSGPRGFWAIGSLPLPILPRMRGRGRKGARIRAGAIGLLVLVLAEIYLGALVAGLRAGYVYNTWPLIDGGFAPEASRLFFDTPLWRNFFENKLTVQFEHRLLADAVFICALLYALDVARTVKKGPARTGAFVLFAAVTLQVALGVTTLILRVPLAVALLHQAMAMLVLTAAAVQAARVAGAAAKVRSPSGVIAGQRVRPEVAGPMTGSAKQSSG